MAKNKLQEQLKDDKSLSKEKFIQLDQFIANLEEKSGALITVLHKAQNIFGYLPRNVQLHISRKLDIPAAEVFGVVSFYSYFITNPIGKYNINVCMGTACFVKGADKIIDKIKEELDIEVGETTGDKLFTLNGVRCIGACGLAPVVMVNDKVYGNVTLDDVDEILNTYREGDADDN